MSPILHPSNEALAVSLATSSLKRAADLDLSLWCSPQKHIIDVRQDSGILIFSASGVHIRTITFASIGFWALCPSELVWFSKKTVYRVWPRKKSLRIRVCSFLWPSRVAADYSVLDDLRSRLVNGVAEVAASIGGNYACRYVKRQDFYAATLDH